MLPLSMQVPASVVLLAGGAIACFGGYRLFRFVLGVYGFILGALVGSSMVGTGEVWVILLAGAGAAGPSGALVLVAGYFVGVAIIGAGMAAFVVNLAWRPFGGEPHPVALVVAAAIGAFAAMSFQRHVIIVGTAFGGAWTMLVGGGRPDARQGAREPRLRRATSGWCIRAPPGRTGSGSTPRGSSSASSACTCSCTRRRARRRRQEQEGTATSSSRMRTLLRAGRLECQSRPVRAVAFARGLRAVGKDVAQMAAAAAAVDLDAPHAQRAVFLRSHRPLDRREEARPPAPALELRVGREQRLPAAGAHERACAVLVEQGAGARVFRVVRAEHGVLHRRQRRLPFGVCLGQLERSRWISWCLGHLLASGQCKPARHGRQPQYRDDRRGDQLAAHGLAHSCT